MEHQAHLQNHGPALLHHARLAVAHAGGRYPLQARQGTGPTRVQDTQEGIQGSQALGEEGAERFQIRVGLVAAEPVARDDQGAFRAGMQRAHASQVVAQKQALVEKIQARTVQDSLQKRANGVQAKGRRAGVPDARGRIRRVYRRRGCNPDAAEPKLWLEAHGRAGDEQDHVFNKIDPDVWRNVKRPAHHQYSRLCKLGDVPRIPRRDPPGSSKILHGTGQRILPQVKTIREYVESAGDDIALEFLPPYTPQLNPIETAWRDLKRRLAGRHFRSTDELKRAITTIVECEMGNRLKGYLVA